MTPQNLALIFLSFGLIASLYLSLQIKLEMRRKDLNWHKEVEQVRFQLNEQRSNWIRALHRIEEPAAAPAPEPVTPLKLVMKGKQESLWGSSTKAKAVEMVKRGETSAKISAVLSLPKPEVEFLIKLERTAAKA